MVDKRTKLSILHDDNGTFVDHTDDAADYSRDDFSIELIALEDNLYIGFEKPVNATYVELTTANVNANSLVAEAWDGSAWSAIEISDETKGMTRSGFIFWDRTDMTETTVNGEQAYWIRLRPDADHSATVVRGMNVVYSNDVQLQQEFYEVTDPQVLPPGQSSHIMTHVSVRNRLVQKLSNSGYHKYKEGNPSTPRKEPLDQWDLLDIFEMRQAATYMALEKIFFNLSDGPDDNWWAKYREYAALAEEQFSLALASLDTDDDGEVDNDENLAHLESKRLVY